ncbi:MAG: pyrroline-5-carboxylate reductase dimerization domain-containing protein, partial [Sedimentibacter sp.]
RLKEKYPSINICESNIELATKCKKIMICVEPLNLPKVLLEIQPFLKDDTYLMISTSMVAHKDLCKFHKGSITIFMPTLISMVNGGITITYHNEKTSQEEKMFFEFLIDNFSEVKVMEEEDIALCQTLTASFPGFFAEMMLELVKSASKRSKSETKEDLEHILLVSLLGASRLHLEKNLGFEETIDRVSTKGGVTFEGVKVFKERLPEVFDAALDAAIARYKEITELASKQVNELI